MKYINVYGTGNNAFNFILNSRSNVDFEIRNVICSDHYMQSEFLGIPVTRVSNAEKILEKYYTVIASSENAYWEIKEKLFNLYKLVEFDDYIYFDIFQKKISIIYGNCHTGVIKEILRRSKPFMTKYGFYPLPQIQEMQSKDISFFISGVAGRCNLFLHQCIWRNNTYGEGYASEAIINKLNPDCEVIGIPNVYRMPQFLFPQMIYGSKKNEGRFGFQFEDSFINSHYHEMTIKEMSNIIENDYSVFDANSIFEGEEQFFQKLADREKEWDISIYSYIKNHLKTEQLFYDPNHPTYVLLKYISNEILKILGLYGDNEEINDEGIIRLDSFEIPIYGCVKHALGIKFTKKELRVSGVKLNSIAMDIEEYVRQYCCWHKFIYKQ